MAAFARQAANPGQPLDPGFLVRLKQVLYLFAFAAIALGWVYALWHLYGDRKSVV